MRQSALPGLAPRLSERLTPRRLPDSPSLPAVPSQAVDDGLQVLDRRPAPAPAGSHLPLGAKVGKPIALQRVVRRRIPLGSSDYLGCRAGACIQHMAPRARALKRASPSGSYLPRPASRWPAPALASAKVCDLRPPIPAKLGAGDHRMCSAVAPLARHGWRWWRTLPGHQPFLSPTAVDWPEDND